MSEEEKIRLNEIIFCKLFQQLLRQHVNPIKVYDLIIAVAAVVGANTAVLDTVISSILDNDRHYMPTKEEYAYLLRKSDVPVRRVCQLVHLSNSTYYKMDGTERHITRRFTEAQYQEMIKVLRFFKTSYENMEGSTV